jgi:ATP phosphoribosyltransferase regulatory subunit
VIAGAGRPGLAGRAPAAARTPKRAVGFDLSDMSGYAYYSGPRFALYGAGWSDALARGGRYDEVGAVFGRNRPAVGFSLT